jgi:nicotinamidase-related amidase
MVKTLLQLAGATPVPSRLGQSVLVLIDVQNEYFDGPLKLAGVEAAARVSAGLLARGQIHATVAPLAGETIVDKGLPSSFASTTLADVLADIGPRPLVVAGFMTHMCVSATVRSALDRGLSSTVAQDATATRDLPDPTGGVLPADTVHRAALAAIADRFATVVPAADIPD